MWFERKVDNRRKMHPLLAPHEHQMVSKTQISLLQDLKEDGRMYGIELTRLI